MRLCKFTRLQYFKSPQQINQMGKHFKESAKKLNIRDGEAIPGVTCDNYISHSDELKFQSNYNLQVRVSLV